MLGLLVVAPLQAGGYYANDAALAARLQWEEVVNAIGGRERINQIAAAAGGWNALRAMLGNIDAALRGLLPGDDAIATLARLREFENEVGINHMNQIAARFGGREQLYAAIENLLAAGVIGPVAIPQAYDMITRPTSGAPITRAARTQEIPWWKKFLVAMSQMTSEGISAPAGERGKKFTKQGLRELKSWAKTGKWAQTPGASAAEDRKDTLNFFKELIGQQGLKEYLLAEQTGGGQVALTPISTYPYWTIRTQPLAQPTTTYQPAPAYQQTPAYQAPAIYPQQQYYAPIYQQTPAVPQYQYPAYGYQ